MPTVPEPPTKTASTDEQLALVWNEARNHLHQRLNDSVFRLWFERTVPVSLQDEVFVLGVPNDFAREWVESRFADTLRDSLAAVLNGPVAVRVIVDDRAARIEMPAAGQPAAAPAAEPRPAPVGRPTDAAAPSPLVGLNPRYIFDRFVVGPHNEYANAVARSVAAAPATAYNPVFIYADTGLGKTHLIQAVAHEAARRHAHLQVKYVTVEQFTDDFINAVTEKGRIEGFKTKYRDNDVLLIDDVQFLAEKQQTQVEFFHTFNSLYEANKQIVITSDRQPRELEELEERLRSRFGQGVVVDIGRPDLETRIAILRRQVKWEGYKVQDPEVLDYIAARVSTNIRELEGALTRVVSYASLTKGDVTLDVAKEALRDILPKGYQHPVTIEMIQSEIAREFGCHVSDLRGDKRSQDIAYARQIAMYLCRELTESSLPQIGDRFGGRHHTTVLYAVNKVERLLTDDHDRHLHELIQAVQSRLKNAR